MKTNREQYLTDFEELTKRMLEITKAKNADYTGDDTQPFHNFTMVEKIGAASAEQAFFTRMTDKLMRFASFIRHGKLEVSDEKIEDTLLDLANYCLLCICYMRSKKK